MTVDEFNQGMQVLIECWNGLTQSLVEAAESIEKALGILRSDFSNPKLWPKRNGIPPKKYGMSLHKRPHKAILCYSYIHIAPRNRPYQRRAY